MLASILLILLVLHLILMVLGPLLTLRFDRRKTRPGARVLTSWLGFFSGYLVCGYLLQHASGAETVLDTETRASLTFASWGSFFGGLSVVAWAFVKSSRMRKQRT